jgi:hypothetical protein
MTNQFGAFEEDVGASAPQDRISENFEQFHATNPEVWDAFKRFTFELIAAGYTHGSAGMIAERIRWETGIRRGSPLKLNNNYRSRYVRLFEKTYPQYQGFFRKRKLRKASADSTRMTDPIYGESA